MGSLAYTLFFTLVVMWPHEIFVLNEIDHLIFQVDDE